MTMSDKKGSDFRSMVVSMLTGFAGSKNVISIPHVFFKWTNRNHPLAIFFSQALYWHGKTDHPEKWFARTLEEWDEETGLGRAQLERAAVILEQVGLKREVKRSMWHGFVPVVHYRFDEDKLFEAARAFFEDGKTLSLKSTEESRKKLKEDNAIRAEKRKGHLNVTSKPDLNVTSKRQSNFTRKREMNATSDSYIKTSRDQEETTEEITTLSASADSAVSPVNDPFDLSFEAVDPVMFPVKGEKQISAAAEKGRKRLSKPTTTTPSPSPLPQNAARTLTKLEREIMAEIAMHPRSRVTPTKQNMDCAAKLCDDGLMACEKIQGKALYSLTDEGHKALTPPVAVDDVERFSGKLDEVKGEKAKRKPNRMAQIIDGMWGKGVSGALLPMLMGRAKKKPHVEYNIEGGMTEAEIVAFSRWYRKQNPGLNMPETPYKVEGAIESFRNAIDYEGWMAEGEKYLRVYFPKESTPPQLAQQESSTEEIIAFKQQIVEQLATSGLDGMFGDLFDDYKQENIS
jgi:hypothetical protein